MSHPVMSLQFFVFSTLCLFVIRSHAKCEIKDVMGCVVHMKSRNVIIDADIMKIVYNVSSEAKLLHMCRTYNDVLACLRQKTSMCADEDLRVKLTEVSRLLLFLCSPFSLKNQKTLLEVAPCTKKVLQTPLSLPNCTNHDFSSKLTICRKKCKSNSVDCQSQVQMSELAVCSVVSIENKCGSRAADFYSQLQSTMINGEYPIQCDYGHEKMQHSSPKAPRGEKVVKVRQRIETKIFRTSRVSPQFSAFDADQVTIPEEPMQSQLKEFPGSTTVKTALPQTTVPTRYVPWYLNSSSNQDDYNSSYTEAPLDIKIQFVTPAYLTPQQNASKPIPLFNCTQAPSASEALEEKKATILPKTNGDPLSDILQSGKQMAKVLATKLDEFAENGHAYIESITGSRQQSDVEEKNIVPKQALNELFSAIASLSQSMRQQQHTNGSSIA
ncbi:hypothetical protein QR680_001852 [Steinernema hermaphroditum]|uniref:Chondroitin proteoglycan 4 domain-containing protein n=1 Tax=Steinernema hermaphroditum TaxID=289476 RepID=A0AA39LGV7_9BILA|nr:hypothetical protein QR680_001852 [Steinernema hermaphroditum]